MKAIWTMATVIGSPIGAVNADTLTENPTEAS